MITHRCLGQYSHGHSSNTDHVKVKNMQADQTCSQPSHTNNMPDSIPSVDGNTPISQDRANTNASQDPGFFVEGEHDK